MAIVDEFDVYLFDLDGVIYVGDEALPGSVQALKKLRQKEKAIRFVTNDPQLKRSDVVIRLNNLGVEAHIEEVISSGWATAQFLHSENIFNAFVLGNENLKEELNLVGIKTDNTENVEAVVVGKPFSIMFQFALNNITSLDKVIMIGDTIETDILGAHKYGISSILISDCCKKTYPSDQELINPNFIIRGLMNLFDNNVKVFGK